MSARPAFVPVAACRISTACPCRPGLQPAPGRIIDEASARVHCHSPHTSLRLTCDPGRNGVPGLSLSFAPSRAGPGNARQGGDRPGHCLDYVPGISQPPSTYSLTTCDLMSQGMDDLCAALRLVVPDTGRTESAGRLWGSELVVAGEWVALRGGLPDWLGACRPGELVRVR